MRKDDGTEERVAVLGEDFREVSPGYLPRTLEELRAGRRRNEEVQQVLQNVPQEQEESNANLEETLDQMFAAASLEEDEERTRPTNPAGPSQTAASQPSQGEAIPMQNDNVHAQAMTPAGTRNREYQARRVAALRRELQRMRNGIERVISGLRDLGENVPDSSEATGRLSELSRTLDTISGTPSHEDAERAINSVNELARNTNQSQPDRTLANIQVRVEEARTHFNEARRARDQAASELDLAESDFRRSQQRLQRLQQEQRTAENYVRIFGTREEMMAQGENYESPIGGMFSRAYDRFRAAEEVRREERTLRQVLDDETRGGGEEEIRRLSELEGRPRDVWGAPQRVTPLGGFLRSGERAMPEGEVPTSGAIGRSDSDIRPSGTPAATYRSLSDAAPGTPPVLSNTREEEVLEEYYALLRQQDGRQQVSDSTEQVPDEDFPRNMLNAVMAAREREPARGYPTHADTASEHSSMPSLVSITPPERSLDRGPQRVPMSQDEWWHRDAEHIIRALTSNDELRDELGIDARNASALLAYFMDDIVSESDRMTIDGLLRNPRAIWGTGLPSEWLGRRRHLVENANTFDALFFRANDPTIPGSVDWASHHNPFLQTELVAQAYQMSLALRQEAVELNPREQLQMLYRLQAGQRTQQDIVVLASMRENARIWRVARVIYCGALFPESGYDVDLERRRVDAGREQMARDGDHSRAELETRRRETQAFAVAAGRQAMQTGGQALYEGQLAERDEAAQAASGREAQTEGRLAALRRLQVNNVLGRPPRITAYRQLTLSDYITHSPSSPSGSSTGSEPDDERGLDARDSGRPEPKADEELKVQMECKICYTQLAEIACLPCGHLVMCRWCSDQHSPCLQHDRTRPRRAAGCPVCRKGIRQKVRVFRA